MPHHNINYRGADKSLDRPGKKQANVSVRMALNFLRRLALQWGEKKLDDRSRLDVVEITRAYLTCSRACFLPGWANNLPAHR